MDAISTKNLQATVELTRRITANPELARPLLDILERAGNNPEQLSSLTSAALQEVKEALPLATATTTVDKAAVKQAFMEKYGIQVLGESQVALSLPAGTSRIEFLQAAQELAKSLHGQNAIYDSRLNSWAADKAFTSKGEKALQIAADANVQGSTKHTRSQMVEKKWLDLGIEDLAVAHAAYFIATGKDAFAGNVVRARGGALRFLSDGLGVGGYFDDFGSDDVSASRALPFPNSKT